MGLCPCLDKSSLSLCYWDKPSDLSFKRSFVEGIPEDRACSVEVQQSLKKNPISFRIASFWLGYSQRHRQWHQGLQWTQRNPVSACHGQACSATVATRCSDQRDFRKEKTPTLTSRQQLANLNPWKCGYGAWRSFGSLSYLTPTRLLLSLVLRRSFVQILQVCIDDQESKKQCENFWRLVKRIKEGEGKGQRRPEVNVWQKQTTTLMFEWRQRAKFNSFPQELTRKCAQKTVRYYS